MSVPRIIAAIAVAQAVGYLGGFTAGWFHLAGAAGVGCGAATGAVASAVGCVIGFSGRRKDGG